jgi:hypothetical protein
MHILDEGRSLPHAGPGAFLRRLGVGGLALAASLLLADRPTFAQG